MKTYNLITKSIQKKGALFSILIDPDKVDNIDDSFFYEVNNSIVDLILVGGSLVSTGEINHTIKLIRKGTNIPVLLFPGDTSQVNKEVDAILFLSLISGRSSEYLIGKHIISAPKIYEHKIETIPTGYI